MPRQSENRKREIRVLYDDPIVFGHAQEPVEEPPTPSGNSAGPAVFLIAGSILALLSLWWLAPDWLSTILKNFTKQILRSAGQ